MDKGDLKWFLAAAQNVGESDCRQQSSGSSLIYDAESRFLENGRQFEVEDDRVDKLLVNADGPRAETEALGQVMVGELPTSESRHSGVSYCAYQVEGQKLSSGSHDYDGADISTHNCSTEPCLASESSHQIVATNEYELPSYSGEGEPSFSEPQWLEPDESVALWVKWRGKWQAGIRCARADWPLSTLKAKPTHDRKTYSVIFFPHTRNYSWADTLLVCPINEFPQPITYRTHNAGLKLVKDLSIARRFIMQKLAVGILNIIDQFHTDALIETARDMMVWKEFAMQVSSCSGYSELGRMLLKLQNMILHRYMNSDWLQQSSHSWAKRCHDANSAESIEMLKEELYDSILWIEVNSLRDVSVQPTLGSEWKAWKHEVMKSFSTSHPIPSGGDVEQRSMDGPLTPSLQVCRKRPKLEIRRAEPHISPVETNGPEFRDSRNAIDASGVSLEVCKGEDNRVGAGATESHGTAGDRWDEIVVEVGNSQLVQTKDVELTPVSIASRIFSDSSNKNQQCVAFIEAKGRQCVRWANDGDVYCCVHLSSRFTGNTFRAKVASPTDTPMCGGTTVLGTSCKHRSLFGSSFCKKHRPQNDGNKNTYLAGTTLKRKHGGHIPYSESIIGKEIELMGEVESPLQVDPVSMIRADTFNGKSSLTERSEYSGKDYNGTEVSHCIGSFSHDDINMCLESPKRHSLYCDQHLPGWLKRARNGKSKIVSKEVFIDLLGDCRSQEQKLHLHQACDLYYRLFKSIFSVRNPTPIEVQLQWALSEASKNFGVGEFLLKLASTEKERLGRIWGFDAGDGARASSSLMEEPVVVPLATDGSHDNQYENAKTIKCIYCPQEFPDDQTLGAHWMDSHKKEAKWLFRGYACAICLDSFTNKKVLETHVQERHHVQYVEQCMLLHCIPCGSHFGNIDELWLHVLSVHLEDIRRSKVAQQHNMSIVEEPTKKLAQLNASSVENNSSLGSARRFVCKICGLKFDLLPDLGRHHQAAHMAPSLASSRPAKKGVRYYAYNLKSGRLTRPRFKKGQGSASYRIRNRVTASIKKHIQSTKLLGTGGLGFRPYLDEALGLGKLVESQCSTVAKILYSEIQRTKPRPNNLEILSIARSACCKLSLKASLESRYGELPEHLYLKAAKLCSEHNIQVNWHQAGFVCPNGCKPLKDPYLMSPLVHLPIPYAEHNFGHSSDAVIDEWEKDECHYIIDSLQFRQRSMQKSVVLCDDISFGQESVPIACVVDECLLDFFHITAGGTASQNYRGSMPWESFTYIMKPLLDQSLDLETQTLQLGCSCPHSTCSPETCEHPYLFDNDYEDAKDIYGKAMCGRFSYDKNRRIILEEGYLVYECNHMCSCSRTCPNRVLQNGVQVNLEVYRTERKGWAVRVGQEIQRGTFICEYIGEVADKEELNKRSDRYGEGCNYLYDVDAHINDMSRLIEGQAHYIIDATRYGNVSRFINHSCSPNLVNHQVLVESMDCHRAHIGLYASRDIALGEELTCDYRYKLSHGEGYPCHCGTPNCRGRLH